MQIRLDELKQFHAELIGLRKDTPIGYERGKNIVRIERVLRQIDETYVAERKLILDKYAKKDKAGNYIFIDEADGPKKRQVHDFGDEKEAATKELQDLWDYTYLRDQEGNPVKVEIDIYKAKKENAEKLVQQDLDGLAYAIEFMDI